MQSQNGHAHKDVRQINLIIIIIIIIIIITTTTTTTTITTTIIIIIIITNHIIPLPITEPNVKYFNIFKISSMHKGA
jgi:hypothetical protein